MWTCARSGDVPGLWSSASRPSIAGLTDKEMTGGMDTWDSFSAAGHLCQLLVTGAHCLRGPQTTLLDGGIPSNQRTTGLVM
jgi:hypothetical protein